MHFLMQPTPGGTDFLNTNRASGRRRPAAPQAACAAPSGRLRSLAPPLTRPSPGAGTEVMVVWGVGGMGVVGQKGKQRNVGR